jgi:TatD DNase family protein
LMLIDSHCHIHEYEDNEIRGFKDIKIVGVSLDIESSQRTLELSRKFDNIDPFLGFHPWHLHKSLNRFEEFRALAESRQFMGLGEVGVDARFARSSLKEQLRIFDEVCKLAAELDLPLNVHALGEWRNIIRICNRAGVRSLLLHWYTGPIELLGEIESSGYFVSINPTVVIHEKQIKVLDKASPEIILTESDGPYRYRELNLSPASLEGVIGVISKVKGIEVEEVKRLIYRNYTRFISR